MSSISRLNHRQRSRSTGLFNRPEASPQVSRFRPQPLPRPAHREPACARLDRPQSFVSNYGRGAGRIDAADFILVVRALGLNPKEMVGASGVISPG